jgi:hypothetical protein
MIPYTSTLLAVGGARTGLPPVNLLEVQDTNGNNYFWADRKITMVSILTGVAEMFLPWLMAAGPFKFNRSQVTDSGSFQIQNVSGDTLARDVETMLRATTLEGALFIYRCYQADAQQPWIQTTGKLTLEGTSDDLATFHSAPLSEPAQEDTPMYQYCETCQLNWAGPRCGSTASTECLYSFQSCQVVERPMISLNSWEKNYGETIANTPLVTINRGRRV